jgi:hypothetical protein
MKPIATNATRRRYRTRPPTWSSVAHAVTLVAWWCRSDRAGCGNTPHRRQLLDYREQMADRSREPVEPDHDEGLAGADRSVVARVSALRTGTMVVIDCIARPKICRPVPDTS